MQPEMVSFAFLPRSSVLPLPRPDVLAREGPRLDELAAGASPTAGERGGRAAGKRNGQGYGWSGAEGRGQPNGRCGARVTGGR